MLITVLTLSTLIPQNPADQVTLSASTRKLEALGITIRDERILDGRTGDILRRTTDAATGEPVDGDALLLREAKARNSLHGKISHELRAKLQKLVEVEVVFWLKHPTTYPDLRQILDATIARGVDPEEARRQLLATAARHTAPLTTPFAVAVRSAGHTIIHVDPYVPIVFVKMKSKDVAAIARRAEVDQAYYSFPRWMDESIVDAVDHVLLDNPLFNDKASPTARTDAVHRRGITGAGVKVLVQDTQPCSTVNPYLPMVTQKNAGSAASHATAVAGIIASTHSTYKGAAPGLGTIWDAGGSGDVNAPKNWAWGIAQGISFGNCSWWNGNRGSIVFLDRYFDYIIRNFAVMMFKSIGNQGNGRPTTTPGNGYNVTGTGSFYERDTHDWADDTMSTFSSTANPSPGHEKPEVAAPGQSIVSTRTTSPWYGSVGSGTSYASPVTCGTAALLAATDSALKAKPEVVKAMLMAGAFHNIHGAAVLSDYDGAGGIDAAASQSAVAQNQYVSTKLTSGSFSNGIWSQKIALTRGDETRVVGLWFSEANSSYTTDTLKMDLDMTVEDPTGKVVASSASSLNPFEIVMFVPQASGLYTVKLKRQRFQGTSEPFALAWTTAQNAATDLVTLTGSGKIGTTMSFDFFDRYHPGANYVGLLSGSGPGSVFPLNSNRMLAMAYDAATIYGFTLPGFVGSLNVSGQATGTFAIPNLAGIKGIKLYYAMVTWAQNFPGLVKETSDVGSFTIQ